VIKTKILSKEINNSKKYQQFEKKSQKY